MNKFLNLKIFAGFILIIAGIFLLFCDFSLDYKVFEKTTPSILKCENKNILLGFNFSDKNIIFGVLVFGFFIIFSFFFIRKISIIKKFKDFSYIFKLKRRNFIFKIQNPVFRALIQGILHPKIF